jgi:hypothetical protein
METPEACQPFKENIQQQQNMKLPPSFLLNEIRIRENTTTDLRVDIQRKGFFKQCCGSGLGYGIRCLFDPWIRDPGWIKKQDTDPG